MKTTREEWTGCNPYAPDYTVREYKSEVINRRVFCGSIKDTEQVVRNITGWHDVCRCRIADVMYFNDEAAVVLFEGGNTFTEYVIYVYKCDNGVYKMHCLMCDTGSAENSGESDMDMRPGHYRYVLEKIENGVLHVAHKKYRGKREYKREFTLEKYRQCK